MAPYGRMYARLDISLIFFSKAKTSSWFALKVSAANLSFSTAHTTLIPAAIAPRLNPPAPENMSIPIFCVLVPI